MSKYSSERAYPQRLQKTKNYLTFLSVKVEFAKRMFAQITKRKERTNRFTVIIDTVNNAPEKIENVTISSHFESLFEDN